jgi:hemerythrin superfamily protein
MKVTVFLRKDHELLKSLFDRYEKLGNRSPKERETLFSEIQREIMIHSQTEIEIFYPALQNTPSEEARQMVDTALAEHSSIETLLSEIGKAGNQDKQLDAKTIQLFDQVRQHMEHEEEEIFDEARKSLSEFRLEELGLEMEERRRILTQLAA